MEESTTHWIILVIQIEKKSMFNFESLFLDLLIKKCTLSIFLLYSI